DRRNKFLEKEIAVAQCVPRRVDVESALALRSYHEKIADFVLATKIVDDAPSAGTEKSLLILAEAMKEIQHGIAPRCGTIRVVISRQLHAVVNRLLQNAAVQGAAIGTALRICRE